MGARKLTSFALSLLLIVPGVLLSTPEENLKQAALFFDAGEFSRAQEIYESMLRDSLTPWQQAVITYNLANALIAQNKSGDALAYLKTIVLDKNPPPLLKARVEENTAIALLKLANSQANDSVPALEKSVYLFLDVEHALENTAQAVCDLQIAEGAEKCLGSRSLNDLKVIAKKSYAQKIEQLQHLRINQASVEAGVPFLLVGIEQLLRNLAFLTHHQMDNSLRDAYVNLAAQDASTWQSLWNNIETKMSMKSSNEVKSFAAAKQQFEKGLEELKNHSFEQTEATWTQAKNQLSNLIHMMLGDDPQEEILGKLLAFYNYAFMQKAIQKSTLEVLKVQQKETIPLLPEKMHPTLKQAQEYLDLAEKALGETKFSTAAFYVEAGRHAIQSLFRKIRPKTNNPPMELLEDIIQDQEHALYLNRLYSSMPQSNQQDQMKLLIQKAQAETVKTADRFLSVVLKYQQGEFNKPYKEKDDRCQAHPWDEALPLFDEGTTAANAALPNADLPKQEEALGKWQQTLNMMRRPKSSFTKSCRAAESTREEQKNEENAKEEQKPDEAPEPKMDQVLRQLMEMNMDDAIPKEMPAIQYKGAKPW